MSRHYVDIQGIIMVLREFFAYRENECVVVHIRPDKHGDQLLCSAANILLFSD